MKVYAKWLVILLGVVILGAALASCGQAKSESEPQPPEIMLGASTCSHCGMLISEARSAAALLLNNGEYLLFDDIGEMAAYTMDRPDISVRAWFVHDANDETWLRGETAFYVKSKKISTPMGSGVLAFRDESAALEFAAQLGTEVLTFDKMRATIQMTGH